MKNANDFHVWMATVAGGLLVLSFFVYKSRTSMGEMDEVGRPIDRNLVVQRLNDVHASDGVHPLFKPMTSDQGSTPVPAKPVALMRRMFPTMVPAPMVTGAGGKQVVASLEMAKVSLVQATAALETAKAEIDSALAVRTQIAKPTN